MLCFAELDKYLISSSSYFLNEIELQILFERLPVLCEDSTRAREDKTVGEIMFVINMELIQIIHL